MDTRHSKRHHYDLKYVEGRWVICGGNTWTLNEAIEVAKERNKRAQQRSLLGCDACDPSGFCFICVEADFVDHE